jgi:hypothetical protein
MGENLELGQATYEAYCEHREVNDGATMPTWDQLTPKVRSAWIAAGERALQKGLQQIAPDEP